MNERMLALLLAGGGSTRMRRDKCTLEWNGKPLWAHQLETLRSLRPAGLAVASWNRPEWLPEDTEWLKDLYADRGPLSGLATALNESVSSFVLVLAIDMPCMTPAYLRSLFTLSRSDAGVVPISSDGWEPLAAIYPSEAGTLARANLEEGKLGLQNWVTDLESHHLITPHKIPAEDIGLFSNVNRPTDFERLPQRDG